MLLYLHELSEDQAQSIQALFLSLIHILKEVHHNGSCDVGSAWAKGTVKNPECIDIPTEIEPED